MIQPINNSHAHSDPKGLKVFMLDIVELKAGLAVGISLDIARLFALYEPNELRRVLGTTESADHHDALIKLRIEATTGGIVQIHNSDEHCPACAHDWFMKTASYLVKNVEKLEQMDLQVFVGGTYRKWRSLKVIVASEGKDEDTPKHT